ncbi:MAG: hypothetical protein H6818_21410 [Phycisphaerales bacterium]|nr:hypothetical protein [Phycisphaerales bacterium]MCB9862349.1 hypothetical protein [Phycisphaerales bacterium]
MPRLRHTLLALLIALLAWTIVTAVRQLVWTSSHTTMIFGQGGLKVNHESTVYPNEIVTYSVADNASGWSTIRGSKYTFGYFLLPAWKQSDRQTRFILPYWPIFIALALPWSIMHFKVRRRRIWARAGACANCGYDLKGAQSPNCPECGHRHALAA